jgi:hypothetical protein
LAAFLAAFSVASDLVVPGGLHGCMMLGSEALVVIGSDVQFSRSVLSVASVVHPANPIAHISVIVIIFFVITLSPWLTFLSYE